MTPWLSVLIPSRRPAELTECLYSLAATASDFSQIEVVIVTRDTTLPETDQRRVLVTDETRVAVLCRLAYEQSRAPWVFFANDDSRMETPDWDGIIRRLLPRDGIGVLWPNDHVFEGRLACFPVVSRIVLDRVVPLFGAARHYTVDAMIMDAVPLTRRIYLPQVVLRHLKTDDADRETIRATLRHDQEVYRSVQPRLAAIQHDFTKRAGLT